jgi:prepilin-type N-terminal cleavage/methylation domain-containing protein
MSIKLKDNKGFTLIEIVAALAIIAVVSGGLLQMFVLSSKMNSKADDIDKANALATRVAEDFKTGSKANEFFNRKSVSVFASNEAANINGGTEYTKYYDNKWNEMNVIPSSGFKMKATIELDQKSKSTNAFTPQLVDTLVINSGASDSDKDGLPDNALTASIINNKLTINSYSYDLDITRIKRIGIRVNYPTGETSSFGIRVTNETGKPVDLYVYGTDDTNKVKLIPVTGESSITNILNSYIPKGDSANLNEYRLNVVITRLGTVIQATTEG